MTGLHRPNNRSLGLLSPSARHVLKAEVDRNEDQTRIAFLKAPEQIYTAFRPQCHATVHPPQFCSRSLVALSHGVSALGQNLRYLACEGNIHYAEELSRCCQRTADNRLYDYTLHGQVSALTGTLTDDKKVFRQQCMQGIFVLLDIAKKVFTS